MGGLLSPYREGATQWISLFKSGATFGLYARKVARACHLVGADVEWLEASVRSAARGFRRDRVASFRPRNFASLWTLKATLITDGRGSQRAQTTFSSFLFSIRAPSETLLSQGAFREEGFSLATYKARNP